MNKLEELLTRIGQLERLVRGNKTFEAKVTNVDDPQGLNRIKVECVDIWGEGNESPWLADNCNVGGAGKGEVFTPTKDDLVSIKLRDGSPDAGEWVGAFRSSRSPIPEEFSNPDINGRKTKSGIVEIYNDVAGSYTVKVADGAEVNLDNAGTVHITGGTVITHGVTKLNEGEFGIVTNSPQSTCPFNGKPHFGSTTCKAAN